MTKDRYLHTRIVKDLAHKMVFVGGPRQVGKTTLAHLLGKEDYHGDYTYLNWDAREDRKQIIAGRFPATRTFIVFDEIHKYKEWKNYLKGIFDTHRDRFRILVTGSARLDLYRHGGDSLMGRYHYFRLHPFSLAEIIKRQPAIEPFKELHFPAPSESASRAFQDLFEFGGFPEPLLAKDQRTLRRFHNERLDRLVRGDIRDLESVRDLSALQILVELLPHKVASLLSLNALREDLEVAHKTISLWMDILERFYYHFRIYPFASTAIKSLRKEPKMYLWDWSQVDDPARRFENMIASHLLKFVHFLQDAEGYRTELKFVRDTEGREVDFLITIDKKPWFAVEVKWTDTQVSKQLYYVSKKLHIPFVYQVVGKSGIDVMQDQVRVVSADNFLAGLV